MWRVPDPFRHYSGYYFGCLIDTDFDFSFQEYGSTGAVHADSEYERRMMSVYNHVLEEVESLNRKYTPVSYMASGICFIGFLLCGSGFLPNSGT